MAENSKTRAWQLYELGRNYNESLTPNQYTLVETNTEFFIGNQWLRLPDTPGMRGLPKPVFNILKRIAEVFIASLTSSATSIHFEPLAYYDGNNVADPDHDAAAFYVAAFLVLHDDPFHFASFYNKYEDKLSKMGPGLSAEFTESGGYLEGSSCVYTCM